MLTSIISFSLFRFFRQHFASAKRADTASILHNLSGVFAFRKAGTCQKFAETPSLDYHFPAAQLTNFIGFFVWHLHSGTIHILFRLAECRGEILVEGRQGIHPVSGALLHFVEVFLHLCGKIHVHDLFELVLHQLGHYFT